eukprot:3800035-Amphidinium_carterae.1
MDVRVWYPEVLYKKRWFLLGTWFVEKIGIASDKSVLQAASASRSSLGNLGGEDWTFKVTLEQSSDHRHDVLRGFSMAVKTICSFRAVQLAQSHMCDVLRSCFSSGHLVKGKTPRTFDVFSTLIGSRATFAQRRFPSPAGGEDGEGDDGWEVLRLV